MSRQTNVPLDECSVRPKICRRKFCRRKCRIPFICTYIYRYNHWKLLTGMTICTYLQVCLYALILICRFIYHLFTAMFICTYLPERLFELIYQYDYKHLFTGIFICTYSPVFLYVLYLWSILISCSTSFSSGGLVQAIY